MKTYVHVIGKVASGKCSVAYLFFERVTIRDIFRYISVCACHCACQEQVASKKEVLGKERNVLKTYDKNIQTEGIE